jgi:hypothetical protein
VFYIHNGVRRALAAREAGQRTIGALILRPGKTPALRRRIPIEVEPLGERGQSRSVPLAEVKLA